LIRVAAGVVCLVVAIACASEPAPVTPAPPTGAAIRYVALGDSYTIGTSVATGDRLPNQLVVRLAGTSPLELVANLGINGHTTRDLMQGELPDLADLQPEFVTLLIGVNDVVRDVPLETYRSNVEVILGAILDEVDRTRVVVVSVPDYTRTPRGGDFGNPEQQRAAIADVNSSMRGAAEARGIAFVDISSVADLAGTDETLVAGDGLHPSGVQYGRWVDLIAPVVEGLLAR
jgi:acyl-CoA thioesterase-1